MSFPVPDNSAGLVNQSEGVVQKQQERKVLDSLPASYLVSGYRNNGWTGVSAPS